MFRSFRMKGDVTRAGFNKIADDAIHRFYHQMHINRCGDAVAAQRLTHHWADGEVRHIVVVHHIEMHYVCACCEHTVDFFAKTGKVRRENGGSNPEIARSRGHGYVRWSKCDSSIVHL